MNNRRTAPGGQMTHMLSAILAKVTNLEKLLAPAIHNLPYSEILDSKGVRLLTKMSAGHFLDIAMTVHCLFTVTKGKFITAVRTCCVPCCWKKKSTLKIKGYKKDD